MAQGKAARAFTRTAAQELEELGRTHGVAMPERASAAGATEPTQPTFDTEDHLWTPECFAPAPGQAPQLWPCWRWSLLLWQAMRTQWRTAGMVGAYIGLDYAALAVVERRIGLPVSEQRQAFAGLQVFEAAQLAQWNEDRRLQAMKGRRE